MGTLPIPRYPNSDPHGHPSSLDTQPPTYPAPHIPNPSHTLHPLIPYPWNSHGTSDQEGT